jgi:hypothetical protein
MIHVGGKLAELDDLLEVGGLRWKEKKETFLIQTIGWRVVSLNKGEDWGRLKLQYSFSSTLLTTSSNITLLVQRWSFGESTGMRVEMFAFPSCYDLNYFTMLAFSHCCCELQQTNHTLNCIHLFCMGLEFLPTFNITYRAP